MTQWEYCLMSLLARAVDTDEQLQWAHNEGFAGEVLHETGRDGRPVKMARTGSLHYLSQPRDTIEYFGDAAPVIARLGLEGWEMISHTSQGGIMNAYFKRSLPTAPGNEYEPGV
jgi:hypothetical protein